MLTALVVEVEVEANEEAKEASDIGEKCSSRGCSTPSTVALPSHGEGTGAEDASMFAASREDGVKTAKVGEGSTAVVGNAKAARERLG